MRSILAGLRTLVLPWGAAPGIPRIVLGPTVPPELVTFYSGLGLTVNQAILFYVNATDYWYEANVELGSSVQVGRGFSVGGSVYETDNEQLTSAGVPGLTELDFGRNTPGLVSFGSDSRSPAGSEAAIFRNSVPVSVHSTLTTTGKLTVNGTAVSTNIAFNADGNGTAEVWHALTLGAGWVNYGAPEAISQYRLIPSPAATLEVTIAAQGGTTTDGTTIATVAAPYRPTHTVHHAMTTSVSGSRSCQLELTAAGNLVIFGVGAAGDLTGTAFFPLDA